MSTLINKKDELFSEQYIMLVKNDRLGPEIVKLSFDEKEHCLYLNHDLDNSSNNYMYEEKRFQIITKANESDYYNEHEDAPIFEIETCDDYIVSDRCINGYDVSITEVLAYSENPNIHMLVKMR